MVRERGSRTLRRRESCEGEEGSRTLGKDRGEKKGEEENFVEGGGSRTLNKRVGRKNFGNGREGRE